MSIIYSISLSFVFLTVQIKLSRFEFTFCNDAHKSFLFNWTNNVFTNDL